MSQSIVPEDPHQGSPHSSPDAELITLGAQLEEAHRRQLEIEESPVKDAAYDKLSEAHMYGEHWYLREMIEAIPAKTDVGRRIKARAVEMALRFDREHECDAPGSFVTLSQSLCRDLIPAAAVQ